MSAFARAIGVKVKEVSKKATKLQMSFGATALVALGSAIPASAAATPNTGDTDVDSIVSAFEPVFETVKAGFKYLTAGAILLTLFVLAFFWIRGKVKQAVSGA